MSTEDKPGVPVSFRERVEKGARIMESGYLSIIKNSPDLVREQLAHARDHLRREIPQGRAAICGAYLEVAMVDRTRQMNDPFAQGIGRGANVVANAFYYMQGGGPAQRSPQLQEFLDALQEEGRGKLSDETGFAMVDFIADDFLRRHIDSLEKNPGVKILILAGADLARKVFKAVYPLSEGLEPPAN